MNPGSVQQVESHITIHFDGMLTGYFFVNISSLI